MPRNPYLFSFPLLLVVSLTPFINKPDSSRDLTMFIISIISLLEIANVVYFAKSEERVPDPKILFWIAVYVTDATVVNPNGSRTLLANGLSTPFNKGKPIFNNGPTSLPRNLPTVPSYTAEFFKSLY